MVLSVAGIVRWRCETGCCAAETSARVVGHMGGVHGVEADGASVLHDLQVGAAGVAFFGGSGGGSSGLSSGGDASGGT